MKHFYENVPRLGNVAVSRHAQAQMIEAGIPQEAFDRVLLEPTRPDIPDGADILWRERDGLRLVILINPTPNRGAKLISTTAGVDEFWFCGSSVIVWRAAGVVVASPTKRGCDRGRAALPRRDARGAGAPREP